MPSSHSFRAIPGSERYPLANAQAVASVDPDQLIKLSIYVRRKATNINIPALHEIGRNPHQFWNSPDKHKTLDAFRADMKDIRAVQKFASANKLKVLESSVEKRSVLVQGRMEDAARAFDVNPEIWEYSQGRYCGRTGPVYVPTSLHGIVQAVFGFDNRPMGRPFFRRSQRRIIGKAQAANTYLPTQLGDLYDFPANTTGKNQNVAILAFNGSIGDGQSSLGGYDPQLLKTYFQKQLSLTLPSLTDVVIQGPGNQPGDGSDPNDATPEVLLDICTAGALAPKAKFFIYFTEFTEQGWVDCINAAVTATPNTPSVISISYGNPEDGPAADILWTKQAINMVSDAFQRAAMANITICCASGDQGSTEALPDKLQHVDFPASSPWVLGCGGTRLTAANGVITSETVWNDAPDSATGGGVSDLFAVPSYQASAGVPPSVNPGHQIGRGVPDVSSNADPETGVLVAYPDGTTQAIGGTSAAAPLWAGLIARLNEGLGKPVGFFNPLLYQNLSSGVLRDITQGDNGAYKAKAGWDPCTGFGSPNGEALLTALKNLAT